MTYLGKISYGIYLYHLFVPFIFWKLYNPLSHYLLTKRNIDLTPLTEFLVFPLVSLILYFLLTVGCASISWNLFERPISSLKRFFTYKASPKKPVTVPS